MQRRRRTYRSTRMLMRCSQEASFLMHRCSACCCCRCCDGASPKRQRGQRASGTARLVEEVLARYSAAAVHASGGEEVRSQGESSAAWAVAERSADGGAELRRPLVCKPMGPGDGGGAEEVVEGAVGGCCCFCCFIWIIMCHMDH